MVGYFEGIDSERGIEWRCSDSLSLRAFLRLETSERVPDHSWLSRTRGRLPHEVHDRVFGWVLSLLAEHGLVRGARIGVDASTMEANAALRHIVRRDTGEDYRAMLTRMARESGIETPSAEDLVRLDRKRKGRKLSNQAWVSETDPQARVAKMKNGTTHLAYKPEHAVDLDTGAVAAAELHPADKGDTRTIEGTEVHTDEHGGYNPLDRTDDYERLAVVHAEEEYVGSLGETTNSVEGFFSQLKRTIGGTHISVSRKHLAKYSKECEFRFNRRQNPESMLPDLISRFPEKGAE